MLLFVKTISSEGAVRQRGFLRGCLYKAGRFGYAGWPTLYNTSLKPVYTCNFPCDFRCDFRLLMDVNEQTSGECSEYTFPHLNIHNPSTRSHPSEDENRTRNRSRKLQVRWKRLFRWPQSDKT